VIPTPTRSRTEAPREASAHSGAADALRLAGPVILVASALVVLVWALAYGGGAAPLAIGDPGPLARWGLPVAKLFVNLSAAGMAGTLVAALFALRAGEREFDIALDTASISAAVFTISAAATGFLTFVDAFNPQIDAGPEFGAQLGRFLVETEVGRTWLITTVAGAALTVLTFAVRSWTATLFVAILALAALVPMGTQGHSGEEAFHHEAMAALILHIIAAAAWLGGLLLMVLVRPILSRERLAGRARSLLKHRSRRVLRGRAVGHCPRRDRPAELGGAVLAVRTDPDGEGRRSDRAGCAGCLVPSAAHRPPERGCRGPHLLDSHRLRARADGRRQRCGCRARPHAPSGRIHTSGAEHPRRGAQRCAAAPELTVERWLTAWNIDILWAVAAAFGVFFYLAGVWRLRRRGDKWPVYRTIMWVAGLLLLVWVTGGVINVYQDYLFSIHMVGHMLLTMAIRCSSSPARLSLSPRVRSASGRTAHGADASGSCGRCIRRSPGS
jgi:hypothetical protein